jgi:hypothetical protein
VRVDCTAVAFCLTLWRAGLPMCTCVCVLLFPFFLSPNFTRLMLVHWPAVPPLCQRAHSEITKQKLRLRTTSQQNISRMKEVEKKKKKIRKTRFSSFQTGRERERTDRPWRPAVVICLLPVCVSLELFFFLFFFSFPTSILALALLRVWLRKET